MNVLLQCKKLTKNLDLQLRQKVGLEIRLMLLSNIELLMQMMINCDMCTLQYLLCKYVLSYYQLNNMIYAG